MRHLWREPLRLYPFLLYLDPSLHPDLARVRVFRYPDMVVLLKPREAGGNRIPNWESSPVRVMDEQLHVLESVTSDCPLVSIRHLGEAWIVSVWDWVPGPGPGDFEISCTTEAEAVTLAMDYFFRDNPWFSKRLAYHSQQQ